VLAKSVCAWRVESRWRVRTRPRARRLGGRGVSGRGGVGGVRSLDVVDVAFGTELCLSGRSSFLRLSFPFVAPFFHLSIYSFTCFGFWLLALAVYVYRRVRAYGRVWPFLASCFFFFTIKKSVGPGFQLPGIIPPALMRGS
jgi:hypothetical protein